jgi:hypothetical protein
MPQPPGLQLTMMHTANRPTCETHKTACLLAPLATGLLAAVTDTMTHPGSYNNVSCDICVVNISTSYEALMLHTGNCRTTNKSASRMTYLPLAQAGQMVCMAYLQCCLNSPRQSRRCKDVVSSP